MMVSMVMSRGKLVEVEAILGGEEVVRRGSWGVVDVRRDWRAECSWAE